MSSAPSKKRKYDYSNAQTCHSFPSTALVPRAVQSVAISDSISADGRRLKRDTVPVYTTAPALPSTTSPSDEASHEPAPYYEHDLADTEAPRAQAKSKSRRNNYFVSTEHDAFLTEWVNQKDVFLAEMLRLEGLRGAKAVCALCEKEGTLYRCKECTGNRLLCAECCVDEHLRLPFHVIESWDGRMFTRAALIDLGLVLQLGHPPGESCPHPVYATREMMVLHTNGWHRTNIMYCQCPSQSGVKYQQLLREELYPATITSPATCATFRLLNTFHVLTLQSKITVYDYYIALNKLTDATGVDIVWDRLKQLLRMVREWRHLKSLKRGGRGHEKSGSAGTTAGELCIPCPACPRPSVNLPANWEKAPDSMKFLYTIVLAIDANFRLKRRAISSNDRDPALGSGNGYFVENKPYLEHVLKHAGQQDISTCTGFAAITQANSRYSKGYATTGVVMMVCARHGMIQPNSVGDLQKGERYCNVDYCVVSCLKLKGKLIRLVFTYDISCQYELFFEDRIAQFPSHLQIELPQGPGELRWAIPKYHFRAHKEEGHNKYSLHLMTGVGRVCGEQIERTWPKHSETAGSTREMAPGSREDTLEDHFGNTNWCVYITMGTSLQRLHKEAVTGSRVQEAVLDEFCTKLAAENLAAWNTQVEAYEKDPTLPDPYYRKTEGMTESEARLQLARDDNTALENGTVTLHEVTPSAMVIELLEIEDLQRKFKHKYKEACRTGAVRLTATQEREMVSRRSAIRRRLTTIRPVQAIYMSCVPALVAGYRHKAPSASTSRTPAASATAENLVEDEPLFVPSELEAADLVACAPGLTGMEQCLRDAQLHECLDQVRGYLHIKAGLVMFKNKHVRHQRPNTRARALLETNEDKLKLAATKYRAARRAKLALSGAGDWTSTWRELLDSDLRTMLADDDPSNAKKASEGDSNVLLSEGRRVTSWIWMGADRGGDDPLHEGMQDAVRVEYLRARARTLRYREQVQLVKEEKRRVMQSLEHEALTWDKREGDATGEDEENTTADILLRQGLAAYAAKQSALRRRLKAKFVGLWAVDPELAMSEDEGEEDGPYRRLPAGDSDDEGGYRDVGSDDESDSGF